LHRRAGGALAALVLAAGAGLAQKGEDPGIPLNTGKEIWEAACVACHGADGKGMPQSTVGFKRPDSFPDFTRCDQTTVELNTDYKAVIRNGGPFRGFSQIMPSFSGVLTDEQIDKVVHYLRGFCTESGWPRGELNVPRALVTEKAYPEDEAVVSTAVNTRGAPAVSNHFIHEQSFWKRNQLEIDVPLEFLHQNQTWYGGFGDVTLGLKRVLYDSLPKGSILSVQGSTIFPAGNSGHGLGSGVTTFETFVAYDQLLPHLTFIQFQGGADLPVDTKIAPRSTFWNTAVGKSWMQNGGLGRMWSPMVEFLATRDLVTGATTDWDVLPQMQVTLSRRQHIRADLGVRVPVTNTAGRPIQLMFYLLWDWQDGKLTEGW